jgi:hypothetical protein
MMELPADWQRLVQLWCRHLAVDGESEAQLMLDSLSTDGVTSQLAIKTDPQRLEDYKQAAQVIRNRLKRRQRRKAAPRTLTTVPPAEQLERMIHLIETNCHSCPLPVSAGTDRLPPTDGDGTLEEEWVGVWLMASMMQHSCLPNAVVHITNAGDNALISVYACRDITSGSPVTISYVDKEFWCFTDRQQHLRRRGFQCQCELCVSVDYSRVFCCRSSPFALCRPRGSGDRVVDWRCECDSSCLVAAAKDIVYIKALEDRLADDEQQLTAMTNSMLNHLHQILPSLCRSHGRGIDGELLQEVAGSLLQHVVLSDYHPIHPFHSVVYQFVNLNVYENSSQMCFAFDCDQLAPFLGCLWLAAVSKFLFPVNRMNTVAVSDCLLVCSSEDFKHHCDWLEKLLKTDSSVRGFLSTSC